MPVHQKGTIITKHVLTGGRLVSKHYELTGSGVREIRLSNDILGRRRIHRLNKRGTTSLGLSSGKEPSKDDVMSGIGSALNGLGIRSKKGKGVVSPF